MTATTVHAAAQASGWSVRMLHYLDAAGLVSPPRSPSGYRLYGVRETAQLRELRQLLADHDLKPADLQVALRLRSEPALRQAVDGWLDAISKPPAGGASPAAPNPPAPDSETSWLRFEQDKHSRALQSHPPHEKENA